MREIINSSTPQLTSHPFLEESQENDSLQTFTSASTSSTSFIEETDSLASPPPSLINRIINFFNPWAKNTESTVEQEEPIEENPIHFTPELDTPSALNELNPANFKLQPIIEPSSSLSDQKIFEGLSKLSDYTLHQIMMIVVSSQSDLAKEGLLANFEDIEDFHFRQSMQKKALLEIKDALAKDETVRGYFHTAQNIGIAVGTIATIASLFGITIPLAFVAAAITAAISTGGKSYYSVRGDQNQSKFIYLNHQKEVYKGYAGEAQDRTNRLIENTTINEKLLADLLRDLMKMTDFIYS